MVGQRTLKNSIRATGVGLHTGKKVLMTLRPAGPDEGIVGVGHDRPAVETPLMGTTVAIVGELAAVTAPGDGCRISGHQGQSSFEETCGVRDAVRSA